MGVVKFCKLNEKARAPRKAHGCPYSDAGYDLFSTDWATLLPGETKVLKVGIAIQLPKDNEEYIWEAHIRGRSSMRKKGIVASLGTIDSGYRGEMGCVLHNLSREPYNIDVGDAVCQLVVCRLPNVVMVESNFLDATERGDGGYGSTGK